MHFSEVLGNTTIKQRLLQTVREGRISHAQLYAGESGSANLALAMAYAQYITCENKQEMDSCGECPSCIKNNKLVHPDIHFVFPTATNDDVSKDPTSDKFIAKWREAVLKNPYLDLFEWMSFLEVDNKQGLISAEESAEIIRKLSLKTYESEYKIMIIWLPEKMNVFSANKLLKILEEPPEKTLFLQITHNYDQLLATITSRSQLVKVLKPTDDEVKQELVKQYGVAEDVALKAAHLANGNYSDAVKIVQSTETDVENIEKFQFWMRLCYASKIDEILKWVDSMAPIGREYQKNFLSYAIHIIRESLLTNMGVNTLVRLKGSELDFCTKFSRFIHTGNTFGIVEELEKASADIERNANPKILFLDLSFKMVELLNKPNK